MLEAQCSGFSILKPLPVSRLGRTVLKTFPLESDKGARRLFTGVHPFEVHLSGFTLSVRGLPFQQQDHGVSACATVALWSSLHNLSKIGKVFPPSPVQITETASRYLLSAGRALPSEGLTLSDVRSSTSDRDESPRCPSYRLLSRPGPTVGLYEFWICSRTVRSACRWRDWSRSMHCRWDEDRPADTSA